MGEPGEGHDEGCGVFDGIEPTQGMAGEGGRSRLLGEVGGQARFEKAGEDTVDPDVPRTQFLGEAFGEPDQSRFAGGVSRLSDRRVEGRVGSDLNDGAVALCHHPSCSRSRAEKGAFEVRVEHGVPVSFFEAGEKFVSGDAGIVDEHVDPLKTFEIPLRIGGRADVQLVATGRKNLRAGFPESGGEGGGKSAATTGDDDDRIAQPVQRGEGIRKNNPSGSGEGALRRRRGRRSRSGKTRCRGRSATAGGWRFSAGIGIDDDGVGFVSHFRAAQFADVFDGFGKGNVAEREGNERSGSLFGSALVDEVHDRLAFRDFLRTRGQVIEDIADGRVDEGDFGDDDAGETTLEIILRTEILSHRGLATGRIIARVDETGIRFEDLLEEHERFVVFLLVEEGDTLIVDGLGAVLRGQGSNQQGGDDEQDGEDRFHGGSGLRVGLIASEFTSPRRVR